MEFHLLYSKMLLAAEDALTAMEASNYGTAKDILISAMRSCEELYISDESET